MMTVDQVMTSLRTQNDGKTMSVEIVYSIMAVFLAPTLSFDIHFAHSDRHLRGCQIPDLDGLGVFLDQIAHRKVDKFSLGGIAERQEASMAFRSCRSTGRRLARSTSWPQSLS